MLAMGSLSLELMNLAAMEKVQIHFDFNQMILKILKFEFNYLTHNLLARFVKNIILINKQWFAVWQNPPSHIFL